MITSSFLCAHAHVCLCRLTLDNLNSLSLRAKRRNSVFKHNTEGLPPSVSVNSSSSFSFSLREHSNVKTLSWDKYKTLRFSPKPRPSVLILGLFPGVKIYHLAVLLEQDLNLQITAINCQQPINFNEGVWTWIHYSGLNFWEKGLTRKT